MLTPKLFLLLLSLGIAHALPQGNEGDSEPAGLKWAPCDLEKFSNTTRQSITTSLDCTAIEVPLDYTNPHSKPLKLELIKVKATKGPSKGGVLINPGGPGVSGIDVVAKIGPDMREALGGEYDILGFDSRGVGRTIPFKCEQIEPPTTSTSLSRRSNLTATIPQLNAYDIIVQEWDYMEEQAEACYRDNKDTGRFLSTAFVARDMLKIVDALKEGGKLRYWGTSYGATLGQTFATMFPNRVERMVIDSVQTLRDYHTGNWISTSRDADESLTEVFRQCIDVGPEKCPIANFTGPYTTPLSLSSAFADALQEHISEPGGPATIRNLKSIILSGLYGPSELLTAVAGVEIALKRNWAVVSDIIGAITSTISVDALNAIACGDSTFRAKSPKDMYALTMAAGMQGMFADVTGSPSWLCSRWKFDAAEKFNATFSMINTSTPLLFVNGLYDPVSSVSSAFEATLGFTGSRILTHKNFGHGSINHPSKCVYRAIHDYFNNGTLPRIGTECEPDRPAFEVALAIQAAT